MMLSITLFLSFNLIFIQGVEEKDLNCHYSGSVDHCLVNRVISDDIITYEDQISDQSMCGKEDHFDDDSKNYNGEKGTPETDVYIFSKKSVDFYIVCSLVLALAYFIAQKYIEVVDSYVNIKDERGVRKIDKVDGSTLLGGGMDMYSERQELALYGHYNDRGLSIPSGCFTQGKRITYREVSVYK